MRLGFHAVLVRGFPWGLPLIPLSDMSAGDHGRQSLLLPNESGNDDKRARPKIPSPLLLSVSASQCSTSHVEYVVIFAILAALLGQQGA
jgi:hypothetical protein